MTERRRWLILFVAWLGWVFDIMDTAIFYQAKGPLLTDLMGEKGYAATGSQVEGLIQMIFIAGWAVGGLVFGALADRWGRSKVMILTILLYCCFTGLTALCHSWEQVAAVRFLTALGIGGEWAAGAALVAESFPDKRRPLAAAFLQTAAAVGPVLAATAVLLLKQESWRVLFLVGLLPALATIFIRLAVGAEGPRPVAKEKQPNPVVALFSNKQWAKYALVAMVIGTVGIAGAGNAAFWMPNLVTAASTGMAKPDIQARVSYVTYAQHVGTLAGVFLFPWLARKFGRRTALAIGFVATPIVMVIALRGNPSYEALFWIAPSISLLAIGLSAVFGLYFPELFPSAVRATGAGFGYNTARILSAPAPWLVGQMMGLDKTNPAHGLATSALVYVIGIAALFFAPETKDKPLPE